MLYGPIGEQADVVEISRETNQVRSQAVTAA
jgi:hypothetical protein